MGVYWDSNAEIITTKNKNASEIFSWLESYGDNNTNLMRLNKKDCSILFSSEGYGSFGCIEEDSDSGNLFQDICKKFKFPILCHERVLPCQGQGYGFFTVFGRWEDGTIRSYKEIVYEDYDGNTPTEPFWADSVQIVNIPINLLTNDLNNIIKRTQNAGGKIESSDFWDNNDGEYYYRHSFLDNCIEEDEDRVNEIFDKELSRFCTWSFNYDVFSAQIENEIDESNISDIATLPEGINYESIRLIFSDEVQSEVEGYEYDELLKKDIMSYQDELLENFQKAYPNCEVKKINKDSNIDIYVPGLHERRNVHINFDVKKDGVNVKLHFVLPDLAEYRFFLEKLSDEVSAYGKEGSGSQGIFHNNKLIAYNKYDEIISSASLMIDLFKNNLTSYSSGSKAAEATETSEVSEKDKKLDLSNLDAEFWAETLGSMAEDLSNKIQVLDISKEDLISAEEGQYANSDINFREICSVEYGDWESLKKYIPLEDLNSEIEEHKQYLDNLRENCEDCLKGACDCEFLISRTILFCEGQYVYSACWHESFRSEETDIGELPGEVLDYDELIKKVIYDNENSEWGDDDAKFYDDYIAEWVENNDIELIVNIACHPNTPINLLADIIGGIDELSDDNLIDCQKKILDNLDFANNLKNTKCSNRIINFVLDNEEFIKNDLFYMYLNIIIDKEIDSVAILNQLSKSNFDDIKKQAENKITLINNEIQGLLSNINGNEEKLIELLVIKKDFDKIADLASDIKSSSDLLEAIFMNEDSGDDAWAAITINPNRIIPDDIDFFNDLNDDAKIIQLNNPTFPLNLLEHIVENINDYENAEELLKLVAQHPNTNDDLMMKLHETQFAEIDYKNIIDDIIKNEDEDKLNTLVNKTDLDPNLLDCILLNGDEISDFCELDISIVGHKDFNLSNKIPIIDDDGYLFICDVDDNKLVLLNPDFNIDSFYDCVKNKTCTKDILTELVKKILEKVEDLKIKDELLKLVVKHPNANDDFLIKLHETQFAEIRLEVCNIVNNRNNSNLTSALDEIREKTEIKFEGPVVEFYGGEYIKDDGSYEKGWERIIEWNIGYKIVKVVSMEDEIELLNKLIEQENINLYDYEYVSHKYSTGYDTLYDADGNEVDFDDDGCEYEEDNYSENEDTIEEKCIILASSYSFKINEE